MLEVVHKYRYFFGEDIRSFGGLGPVRLIVVKKISNSIYGRALFKHVVYDLHKVNVNLVNIAMARLCDRGNVNLGVWWNSSCSCSRFMRILYFIKKKSILCMNMCMFVSRGGGGGVGEKWTNIVLKKISVLTDGPLVEMIDTSLQYDYRASCREKKTIRNLYTHMVRNEENREPVDQDHIHLTFKQFHLGHGRFWHHSESRNFAHFTFVQT